MYYTIFKVTLYMLFLATLSLDLRVLVAYALLPLGFMIFNPKSQRPCPCSSCSRARALVAPAS
jgi:hypothetical protein